MIAEEGIEIIADDANKSLSIKNKCFLTDTQLETIRNGLSGSDKFMTESQIRALIAQLSGGGGNSGDNTSPEGFPKFFKSSTNYTIPKSGRYKIHIVGGGGAGAWWNGSSSTSASGNDSYVEYNSLKYNGVGGSTGISGPSSGSGGIPPIPFNMHAGIGGTKGGDPLKNGESGYGAGGSGGTKNYSGGGGGGSPLNYNISAIKGGDAIDDKDGAKGGKGYGAGGAGGMCGGGGSSGCLNTIVSFINKNTVLKIVIGAGGIIDKTTANAGGDGAQGAVLLEWLGAN